VFDTAEYVERYPQLYGDEELEGLPQGNTRLNATKAYAPPSGRLLPLPVEMQRELKETKQMLDQRAQERDAALEEPERLRQEIARLKGAQP
jgi:hypothetical protein